MSIRSIFALALLTIGSLAAGTTTVTETVIAPDGSLASGQAIITISYPCQSGTDHVGGKPIVANFSNGAFTISLVPNDTCTPGPTTYSVSWVLSGGTQWTETWAVPTSSTPVTVDDVIVPIPAGPPAWTRGTFSIAVTQPLASDTGLIQYADAYPYAISVVSCSTDQGTVTINLDVRTQAAPNTAGTNVLATPLVCNASGTANAVLMTPASVTAGAPVALDVLATAGGPLIPPNVLRVFVFKSAQ
jgi:hypothetical protein